MYAKSLLTALIILLMSGLTSVDAKLNLSKLDFQQEECSALGRIFDIAISPDDQYLIASNWRKDLETPWKSRIWNIKTGEIVYDLDTNYATSVVYSPDGKYIATGNTLSAYIWNASTKELVYTLPRDIEDPDGTILKFTRDGQYILTGGRDGAIVWDMLSGEKIQSFISQQELTLGQIPDISLDGRYVVTFDVLKTQAYLWDMKTGKLRFTFDETWMAKISPDDVHIVTYGNKGMVVWDIETLSAVHTLSTEIGRKYEWEFSDNGQYLLEAGWELWDVLKGELVQNFPATSLNTLHGILPDSSHVLISENESSVNIWTIKSGKKLAEFQMPELGIYSLVFTEDSHYVALATDYGYIQLWDMRNGNKVRSFC